MRPFPKAGHRKVSNRGKQRRKAAVLTDIVLTDIVLTDIPEKRAVEEEKMNKKATVQKRAAIKTKQKEQETRDQKEIRTF